MAEVIEEERPGRETVIIDKHDDRPRSNTGAIVAVIVLIILVLLLLFGRGLFAGGGRGATAPVQPSSPATH